MARTLSRLYVALLISAFLCAAGAASTIGAGPGLRHLDRQLTDEASVLAGDAPAVQSAIDDLLVHSDVRLWVLVVRATDGADIVDLANATFAANSFGSSDLLLIDAVTDKRFGWARQGVAEDVDAVEMQSMLTQTVGAAFASGDHADAIARFARSLSARIGLIPSASLSDAPARPLGSAVPAASSFPFSIPGRTAVSLAVLLVVVLALVTLLFRDRVIGFREAARPARDSSSTRGLRLRRHDGRRGPDGGTPSKEAIVVDERAGKPAEPSMLVDLDRLIGSYYDDHPDPSNPAQAVAFGTSGHRGSSLKTAFNEDHILAMTEAICRYRKSKGIDGPLFIARDTHALSEPAFQTAIEVLVANGVDVLADAADGYTPTPVLSHAILVHNRGRSGGFADGIVITPSHNPPEDGGFKYNPPNGGPADTDVTGWIQKEANQLLADGLRGVHRISSEKALASIGRHDYTESYVGDLVSVIDMEAIRASGLRIGADPLGGASVAYWGAIRDRYGLDLTVTNKAVDPQFGFMTVDWDGRIRMDPSSPYAMARLVGLKDRFDLAVGCDTDADRHGIVAGDAGLMNPNHFLSAAVSYLFGGGRDWSREVGVGKTLVSSSMIDLVTASLDRRLVEVPVGFKWFVEGLIDGTIGFGGEESAGASFLRRDGSVWSTDKDGIIACLLAAEMTAKLGRNPAAIYGELTERFGTPAYRRIDARANREQKAILAGLSPSQVVAKELAGEPIAAILTRAPGNDAPIGGLKVTTEHGWFAARPSGTEEVYKIYAESFRGEEHLDRLIEEAQALVTAAFEAAG